MGWKDWSPSLKGAIIGGVIGAVMGILMIFVIVGIAFAHDCPSSTPCPLSLWENIICAISGVWLSNILPNFMESISPAIIPTTYFLYGAILGWIYGKVKSQKSVSE